MKLTLSTSHAASLLTQDEYANWSYAGATALVEYLEELESDLGEEIELDVCAIRCDYSEYASLQDWADEYGLDEDSLDDREERDDVIRSFIRDNGNLIEFDGGVIVSLF